MRSGFSLIETLLGASILLLAVMLSFSLLPSSWLAVNQGEQKLTAANLAQSLLEARRAASFDNLTDADLPVVPAAGTEFKPRIKILTTADPRLKIVRVTITWTSRQIERQLVRQATVCKLPR